MPQPTITLNQSFTSDSTRYPYNLKVVMKAKQDEDDIIDVTHIEMEAINTATGETTVLDDTVLKRTFDYYAGNVENDIITYFDWEYIYFACLENLE